MSIHIYNSLTRKKEEFVPLNPPQVGMYVCGPTVYDEPHIGHARSAYIFEVIRRYLSYRGYRVKFVRNVTDVDDKIIARAAQEFKGRDLRGAAEDISRKYLDSYHKAMDFFGVSRPDYEPLATEYIPKMIKFIELLIKNGAAYEAAGDVYFDIKKAGDYGKLSNQNLEKIEAGSRVAPGEKKKDPLDFALWKAAKEGEPCWESPWGMGRPGWHIECSAMSSDILGDEFEIHGGGLDLIFPHHENEIAQSEGAGKKFARYWVHHGLLTINGRKMSKSLGNFVTADDFAKKYHNADILKMFFLSAHYSHPIDFNEDKIKESREALQRIMIFMNRAGGGAVVSAHEHKNNALIDKITGDFIAAMDDDFNTPRALSCVFEIINLANRNIADPALVCAAEVAIKELLFVLGISLMVKYRTATISDSEIEAKISERNLARRNKDYGLSDRIRRELEAQGVILEDGRDGRTTWRRKL